MTALSEVLWNAGWRQGSLFSGGGLALGRNELVSGTDELTLATTRLSQQDKCVVASQDCDIVSDAERHVEALVCERIDIARAQAFVNQRRYSARYFPIDPDDGLIALAADRLLISKEALVRRVPEDWPGKVPLTRFVRWLGRRYTRPALPDDVVNWFQNPVVDSLAKLAKKRPEIMRAFSESVVEMRLISPDSLEQPLELELVFMLSETGLTDQAVDALDVVESAIRQATNPELVHLGDIRYRSEEQMSVAEYLDSTPLFLDYLTYRGLEIQGSEPPQAE